MVPHVQTKTEIRETLDRLGVRPRKRHGQNFLIDGNLMRRLADAAELSRQDAVLEIGPGTGGLTDLLVESAGRVIAVEIDPVMQSILRERYEGRGNLRLICGDVLAGKHRLSPEVTSALSDAVREFATLKLAANLPYHAATPVLANLLTCDIKPSLLVFTVQTEVADRFTARPGTREYGPLSVLFQATCDVRIVTQVPPSAFWPMPEVSSTMLRCSLRATPLASGVALVSLMDLVHAGFAYRRKTLRYNLRKFLDPASYAATDACIDASQRAETLAVEDWVRLAAVVGLACPEIRSQGDGSPPGIK